MNKFVGSLLIGLAAGAASQLICKIIDAYRTKKIIDSIPSCLKDYEFKSPKRQ